MQAFNEMCAALEKIPGAGKVRWFFGTDGIVTVGEPQNYAVADAILKTPAAQLAIAKVLGLGYGLAEDRFLLEASQVLPFTQAATQAAGAVPAGLSRN